MLGNVMKYISLEVDLKKLSYNIATKEWKRIAGITEFVLILK